MPLKEARLAAGLTQLQLAEISGVNPRQIRRVELGEAEAGNLTAKNLFLLADALHIDPRELIEKAGVSKRSVESAVYTLNRRETR